MVWKCKPISFLYSCKAKISWHSQGVQLTRRYSQDAAGMKRLEITLLEWWGPLLRGLSSRSELKDGRTLERTRACGELGGGVGGEKAFQEEDPVRKSLREGSRTEAKSREFQVVPHQWWEIGTVGMRPECKEKVDQGGGFTVSHGWQGGFKQREIMHVQPGETTFSQNSRFPVPYLWLLKSCF